MQCIGRREIFVPDNPSSRSITGPPANPASKTSGSAGPAALFAGTGRVIRQVARNGRGSRVPRQHQSDTARMIRSPMIEHVQWDCSISSSECPSVGNVVSYLQGHMTREHTNDREQVHLHVFFGCVCERGLCASAPRSYLRPAFESCGSLPVSGLAYCVGA